MSDNNVNIKIAAKNEAAAGLSELEAGVESLAGRKWIKSLTMYLYGASRG